MDGHMLDGLGPLIVFLFVTCCVAVPLAIWKFVEIVIWFVHHVSVT